MKTDHKLSLPLRPLGHGRRRSTASRTIDSWVARLELAAEGERRIALTRREMPGLGALQSLVESRPLAGQRITGDIVVTYETAVFALLLRDLGADVRWCSDNLHGSLDDACAALVAAGISVFAKKGMTAEQQVKTFEQAVSFPDNKNHRLLGPTIILDDGFDLSSYLHVRQPAVFDGVTVVNEQTTCGVTAARRLQSAGSLRCPVIDVNDAETKRRFDNIYGSRESFLEGVQRSVNMQLAGKRAAIFGFGQVGKGCASALQGIGVEVVVCEASILRALEAKMAGLRVANAQTALASADLVVTATGCRKTIAAAELATVKDGALLINMGHGDMEIDTEYLYGASRGWCERENEFVECFTFPNGRSVRLLAHGFLLNLSAGQGHPPSVMSLTFTNHILAIREVLRDPAVLQPGTVYRFPVGLDIESAALNFPTVDSDCVHLTEAQVQYLGYDPRRGSTAFTPLVPNDRVS